MIGILKIGGGAGIDGARALANVADRVRAGERWVVVHGASGAVDALAARVGLTVQTLTGPGGHTSRYTPPGMIELYRAAAASVNQTMVARLAEYGARPVGLAGPHLITARRHSAIRALRDGRAVVVRDDQSGAITGVDAALLALLLDAGRTPVVAPLALGEAYEPLNVDGDLVAATAAEQVDAHVLIILSIVPGLLRDVSDSSSLIGTIPRGALGRYESLAQGRMKKKLLAARAAPRVRVILADARVERPLDAALAGGGTHIVAEEVTHARHSG